MKKISKFAIDKSEMPSAETTRSFTVRGSIGAKFMINAVQDDTIKFYNFNTNTFADGHNSSTNNLSVVLTSSAYSGNIEFPSGGGTYTIKLIALDDTSANFKKNGIISVSINKQSSNSTITFTPITTNTNNYATFPTSTSAGALSETGEVSFNWDITNASSDAGGFGLVTTDGVDWKDLNNINDLWFFKTTETVDGAVAEGDEHEGFVVKLDDLTDIGVGSYISAVSGGSLNGKPIITSINVSTKQVTLSLTQVFADGITLTIRADGFENINEAIGTQLQFEFGRYNLDEFQQNRLIKSVRAGGDGTTINLNGTYGVGKHAQAGGAVISGVGIISAAVQSVTASSSAGSMVVSVAQEGLTAGTLIYLDNIFQVFNVYGNIAISNYPAANKTIYLDIDKFLTVGTAS